MKVEWYTEISGMYISLAIYGITISKQLMEAMDNPTYIKIGYADEGIVIEPCNEEKSALKITRRGKDSARIGSRGLKKYLLSKGMECGVRRGGKRYEVDYNKQAQMGYINLGEVV